LTLAKIREPVLRLNLPSGYFNAYSLNGILTSSWLKYINLVSTDQTELPPQWNDHGPHAYTFQYTHPQSSLTFMLKGVTLADKFIVHGLAIEV
jgi:hypothetical protein